MHTDAPVKFLETHHLMYSGLVSWRLSKGVYDIELKLQSGQVLLQKVLVM